MPSAPPAVTPEVAETDLPDLPDDRYLNRELSWLDFNARVLALAEDASQPLLERAKFLAIFASNLDEFYMVRVAGLKRREETGLSVRSADGLTPREQLAYISKRNQELVEQHVGGVGDSGCGRASPSTASGSPGGPSSPTSSASGCPTTSASRSSRCSPRSRSTRRTRSPTSPGCR